MGRWRGGLLNPPDRTGRKNQMKNINTNKIKNKTIRNDNGNNNGKELGNGIDKIDQDAIVAAVESVVNVDAIRTTGIPTCLQHR